MGNKQSVIDVQSAFEQFRSNAIAVLQSDISPQQFQRSLAVFQDALNCLITEVQVKRGYKMPFFQLRAII